MKYQNSERDALPLKVAYFLKQILIASKKIHNKNWQKNLLNSIDEFINKLIDYHDFGAGEGIRTLDFNLGKVALYP